MTDITRRNFLQGITVMALAPVIANPVLAAASATADKTANTAIDLAGWRSDGQDFFRAPVLLSGAKEAILIDGSFNFPAGQAVADKIKATGKQLTTIYISCSDPDYYFSLKPIKAAFPDAKVIAAPETIAAIKKNVQGKIDTWGPKLGEYGPQSLDDIVFAEAYAEPTLELEGTQIEIVTSTLMANRRYLWIPSLKAAVGGVYTFDGLHVWTADTPTSAERKAWIKELETMIARKPQLVVASHAATGINNGLDTLTFTRDYLLAYEQAAADSKNSVELIAAMKQRYPALGLLPALEIGAKVTKGEMNWG